MNETITGGCLCGAVRYVCTAEPMAAGHCYCEDCRRSSGTGHCSHLVVPAGAVTVSGEFTVYEKPADSGNVIARGFCPTCGAPIHSTNSGMVDMLFLRASSLDDPEAFQPQLIVFAAKAPSWEQMDSSLPAFDAMPPKEERPIDI